MKSGWNRKLNYKKISHIPNHRERKKIKLAQKTKHLIQTWESKIKKKSLKTSLLAHLLLLLVWLVWKQTFLSQMEKFKPNSSTLCRILSWTCGVKEKKKLEMQNFIILHRVWSGKYFHTCLLPLHLCLPSMPPNNFPTLFYPDVWKYDKIQT